MIFTLTLNPSLDRFIYVDEIIEDDTVRVKESADYPAGKGVDVSRVINELGGHSVAILPLGGEAGRRISGMLELEGVVYSSIGVVAETRTNIIVQEKKHQYRFSLPGAPLSEAEGTQVLKTLKLLVRKDDFLVLSGSIPKGFTSSVYKQLSNEARIKGAKVYIDSDGMPLLEGVKSSPDGIKPNLHELQRLVGRELSGESEYSVAMKEISQQYGINEILLTLGGDGALCLIKGEIYRVKVPKVVVKSAVGAGDSFLGAYCMYCERKSDTEETLRMAAAASSAAVMTPGTELCRYEDVVKLKEFIEVSKI